MKALGLTTGLEGKTMVIQGLGNVGSYTGLISQKEGRVKVICVAEHDGAIYNAAGLDVEALIAHRDKTGSILGFAGATQLATRGEALELECDILVPAALENQINAENAARIKAKIIVEAANGPCYSRSRSNFVATRLFDYPRYVHQRWWCYRFLL